MTATEWSRTFEMLPTSLRGVDCAAVSAGLPTVHSRARSSRCCRYGRDSFLRVAARGCFPGTLRTLRRRAIQRIPRFPGLHSRHSDGGSGLRSVAGCCASENSARGHSARGWRVVRSARPRYAVGGNRMRSCLRISSCAVPRLSRFRSRTGIWRAIFPCHPSLRSVSSVPRSAGLVRLGKGAVVPAWRGIPRTSFLCVSGSRRSACPSSVTGARLSSLLHTHRSSGPRVRSCSAVIWSFPVGRLVGRSVVLGRWKRCLTCT
jgi:hypothetical protein